MLVPLLKKITENKKIMQYFLLLAFIFAFLIPELTEIISFKSEIAASLIEDKMSKMKLFMVLGFTGYFVLGHYLNTKIIKGKTEIFIYLAGILGAIFTIASTSLSSNLKGEANSFFYDNMTINVAAMSIAVFVFFKNHINFKCRTPRREKLLRLFSRCSLGVYLVHLIILDSLDLLFGINSLSFNPIISVPILSLLVLAISYPISILLYKIPVIGEKIV